jgi:hypothetical protein
MPFTEQDKAIIADIVKGVSLAIVRVCKTLEHQQKMDLLEFAREIDLELAEQGTDPKTQTQREVLTNIQKVLRGQRPIAPVHI